MQIRLAIVICNFNKADYLKQCLESVFLSSGLPDHQVIVVDNASTDHSVAMVRQSYPQVLLLENEQNEGGSGGFARGMEYARDHEFSHIALLDNDIRLEKETLVSLFDYLERQPSVGVVGSKILSMDNPELLQELGSYIDWEHFSVRVEYKGAPDNESLPAVTVCDYVPACCLMTRLEVLQKAGSFDRRHFIYWDDMDWCWRVKQAGYEIHAISQARVYHKMGAQNLATTFASYYFERNRVLFFLKHLPETSFDRFFQDWATRCCNTLFFCQFKQTPNLALSLLFGYEDLMNQNLYRQDAHVLPREPQTLFNQLQGRGTLYLYNTGPVEQLRQFVKQLVTLKLDYRLVYSNETPLQLFDGPQVHQSEVEQNACRLNIHNHISMATPAMPTESGLYHADSYGHLIADGDLAAFLQQYAAFKLMFTQILQPVWQERFAAVRPCYAIAPTMPTEHTVLQVTSVHA